MQNLKGSKFGRLTVASYSHSLRSRDYWKCQCSCGNMTLTTGYSLVNGHTKSCGCLRSDEAKRIATRHGMSRTPTHIAWMAMRQRCNDANRDDYERYGGRGITVCKTWNEFEKFLADMGERPAGTSLDRIDVDGNYEPTNCRWATVEEQANNTRASAKVEYMGDVLTITQWSRKLGISRRTLHNRLTVLGWAVDEAFNKPVQVQRKGR